LPVLLDVQSAENPRGLSRFLRPRPPDVTDLFRRPLVERIDLGHPLAVLASQLLWVQREVALVPCFAPQVWALAQKALFG
jgi:hypothetical protein